MTFTEYSEINTSNQHNNLTIFLTVHRTEDGKKTTGKAPTTIILSKNKCMTQVCTNTYIAKIDLKVSQQLCKICAVK